MKRTLLTALFLLVVLATRPLQAKLVDAYPLVVRADGEATITLVFENEPLLATPEKIQLEYICADGLTAKGEILAYRRGEPIACKIDGNTITATPFFRGETEHTLRVVLKGSDPKKPEVLGTVSPILSSPTTSPFGRIAETCTCTASFPTATRTRLRDDGRDLPEAGPRFCHRNGPQRVCRLLSAIEEFSNCPRT